jgi:predicted alpha/beta superfamily hydrolase
MKIISKTQSDFVPNLDVWLVFSEHVGREFRINVAPPSGCIDESPTSVLFCLDGNYAAGTLVAAARSMGSTGELPPLYVTTIGYPLEASVSPMLQRCCDLTPWAEASLDAAATRLWGQSTLSSGGASLFLRFIAEELNPWLRAEYAVQSDRAGLTGSSLAGLFTVWALLTEPDLFNRYNIISPSAFVANHAIVGLLRERIAQGFAPSGRAFVCAGGYETAEHLRAWIGALPESKRETYREFQELLGWVDMVREAEEVSNLLCQMRTPGFSVEHHIFDRETHDSVFLPAVSRGLRSLYQTPVTVSQDNVLLNSLTRGAQAPPRFGG